MKKYQFFWVMFALFLIAFLCLSPDEKLPPSAVPAGLILIAGMSVCLVYGVGNGLIGK